MSNVNYHEVSRKANAGERIKIVDAACTGGLYNNGDELVVSSAESSGVFATHTNGSGAGIWHREYVVLEPIAAPAPSNVNLPDLFAQFIRDNAGAVRSYLAELDPVESAEPVAEVNEPAPLTRAKVIEMARERVAELERIGGDRNVGLPQGQFAGLFYRIEFVINRDKRTVVALVRKPSNGNSKPDAVGIAKAAPDDVFNTNIGKAIAAERALGLTLTDAFVNAPKPTEPLAGMVVQRKVHPYNNGIRKITKKHSTIARGYWYDNGLWDFVDKFDIIDDTDAVYTESAAKDGEAA